MPDETMNANPESEILPEETPEAALPEEPAASAEPAEEKSEPEEGGEENESSPYLDLALQAGVAPLEMRFSQINACYRRLPIAYRSYTYVNSVIEGVIPPEKYSFASDGTDRGIRLAKWNISQAIRAIRSFEAQGRRVDFVTARCPASLCLEDDLYEWLRAFLEEKDFHQPEKLCLEFSQSLLYEDEEKVRASILGLKLLKVRSLMTGCGEKDCPLSSLIRIPVDTVLLAPWLTALTDSRSKGTSIAALIAFLRSLGIEVIGDGVQNDAQISALGRAEAYGYIPSSGYQGLAEHGRLRMTLEEAVAQKEEEI